MRIWRKRDIKTLRKVWVGIFQTLPMNEFYCIFSCFRILVGPAFFPCDELYIGYYGNIHALGKNIVTSFPGSPHKMQFVAFSHVIEYLWENLCIFCVMKYHRTGIWWKKAPIHWETYGYQYPRLSHKDIVSLHFLRLWKVYGKLLSFPI